MQSLPDDGPIDDCLSRLQNMENEHLSDEENETEDIITRNFVPASLPSYREDDAIKNTLAQMQGNTTPIEWPNIDGTPINEFQTPRYIARAFPTLYSTGNADLHAERIKIVKPAEYFQHMLKYKDGRFAHHTR